jgi:putative transposase
MPQSLSRVIIHLIYSTKNREPLLTPPIRVELFPYLATVLTDYNCVPIQIGGIEDHIHLLFGLSRTIAISELVETLKTSTSKWLKTKTATNPDLAHFHWQSGYGAFSLSQSDLDVAIKYIANQETHHAKTTFQEEYRRFLQRYQVPYEDKYVWD